MFINKANIVAIFVVALIFIFTPANAQVPTGWVRIDSTGIPTNLSFTNSSSTEGDWSMEINWTGTSTDDYVIWKLVGLDLPAIQDIQFEVENLGGASVAGLVNIQLHHKDTVITNASGGATIWGSDSWSTVAFNQLWSGSISRIDAISLVLSFNSFLPAGYKAARFDNFRINSAGYQLFYTAGDLGVIQGVVFNDTSGNGIRENEDGLSGIMVYLTGTQVDSVQTDSAGNYKFADLPHGSYTVTSPVASGWFQTNPGSGSYEVTIGPDTLFYIGDFGNHATTAQAFWVNKGWNLNSVPLAVSDYSVFALYPSAITPAYAFDPNSGYQVVDTLENGPAYWIKFSYGHFIFMDGADVTSDTIQVAEGWNLVGAITTPTPVENITSDDPGMTMGYFWKYNSSYETVDTLMANQGYWVKANKAGSIMLGNPPAGATVFKVTIKRDGEMPPPPPGGDVVGSPSTPLGVPTVLRLEQNYPNPFNPLTRIEFHVPYQTEVSLVVNDLLGQRVATLVNEAKGEGSFEVTFDASNLPSGTYYYCLTIDGKSQTKKMILLK